MCDDSIPLVSIHEYVIHVR